MARSVYFVGFLVFLAVFQITSGIDFCGMEDVKPGDPSNKTQFITVFEPAVRSWLKKGQRGYFVENPDEVIQNFLEVSVSDGAYWLQNVTISGTYDSRLIDVNLQRFSEEKGLINYTYLQNVVVRADSIQKVDKNEESVSCEKPLCVRLSKIRSTSLAPLTFFTRCSGLTFMLFEPDTVKLEGYPKNCVKYDQGEPIKCDLKEFNDGLIKIISELVSRSLTEGFRTLCKQVHVNNYWILKPFKDEC